MTDQLKQRMREILAAEWLKTAGKYESELDNRYVVQAMLAARNIALEEAAAHCLRFGETMEWQAHDIAAELRALKDKP